LTATRPAATLLAMRVLSPAKINLNLRIGPPGADGFHPLMSWFVTVGLFDTLGISPLNRPGISFWSDRSDVPIDRTNLIVRAGEAMLESIGDARLGAFIELKKTIPIGGGLGGGSSNGASAIRGLNQFWRLNWPLEKLAKIGAKIGSDVPFFFFGPSSICTGRGEFVQPIANPAPKFAILIFPNFGVSTAQVYRQFDQMKLGKISDVEIQPDWSQWTQLSARQLLPLLVNDLEPPAFAICPELGKIRSDLETHLGRIVRMSGSGSTLFTLADDLADAAEIVTRLQPTGLDARVLEITPEIADDLH
jgi:4-diphosphocytidyl-2-C-methyl-D-erythritol kinase